MRAPHPIPYIPAAAAFAHHRDDVDPYSGLSFDALIARQAVRGRPTVVAAVIPLGRDTSYTFLDGSAVYHEAFGSFPPRERVTPLVRHVQPETVEFLYITPPGAEVHSLGTMAAIEAAETPDAVGLAELGYLLEANETGCGEARDAEVSLAMSVLFRLGRGVCRDVVLAEAMLAAVPRQYHAAALAEQLTYAACLPSDRYLTALLALGAEVDHPDEDEFTALAIAVGNNRERNVERLLQYGADPDAYSPTGSARERAQENDLQPMLELFARYARRADAGEGLIGPPTP